MSANFIILIVIAWKKTWSQRSTTINSPVRNWTCACIQTCLLNKTKWWIKLFDQESEKKLRITEESNWIFRRKNDRLKITSALKICRFWPVLAGPGRSQPVLTGFGQIVPVKTSQNRPWPVRGGKNRPEPRIIFFDYLIKQVKKIILENPIFFKNNFPHTFHFSDIVSSAVVRNSCVRRGIT